MIETGVLIDIYGNVLAWHEPDGRSGGSLPDSPRLWDLIWRYHEAKVLLGFAHSHPGTGPCMPSREDTTTFEAIENALGRSLHWWIVAADGGPIASFVICTRTPIGVDENPMPLPIAQHNGWMVYQMLGSFPSWVYELRHRSKVTDRCTACGKPVPTQGAPFCSEHLKDQALRQAWEEL